MSFFFDRCISKRLVEALGLIFERSVCTSRPEPPLDGSPIRPPVADLAHHDAGFDESALDTTWMPAVAGWSPRRVVITGDHRILSRPEEQQALKHVALTFVAFQDHWAEFGRSAQASRLFHVWPAIEAAVVDLRVPSVVAVTRELDVVVLAPTHEFAARGRKGVKAAIKLAKAQDFNRRRNRR